MARSLGHVSMGWIPFRSSRNVNPVAQVTSNRSGSWPGVVGRRNTCTAWVTGGVPKRHPMRSASDIGSPSARSSASGPASPTKANYCRTNVTANLPPPPSRMRSGPPTGGRASACSRSGRAAYKSRRKRLTRPSAREIQPR